MIINYFFFHYSEEKREKKKEENKTQERQEMQMKTTAYHQLNDAQPVPKKGACPCPCSPTFIAQHDGAIWSGTSRWSVEACCPG